MAWIFDAVIFTGFVTIVLSSEEGSCPITRPDNCLLSDSATSAADPESWKEFLQERQIALSYYQSQETSKSSQSSCSSFVNLIDSDLDPWKKSGITKDQLERAKRFGIHYQIIAGELTRNGDCIFPSRCQGVEYFLHKILNNISNTEFVVNYHDWPQVPRGWKQSSGGPIPVFSFSKTPGEYLDITYPAWAFFSGGPAIELYPRGIGDWASMREKISKNALEWSMKKEIAFFRGSRTSPERDPLILLSRSIPDILDAQYTKNQAWKSAKDTLGRDPAPIISFEDQCNYKYLINLRGVAASFRYKHLFLCKSTVLQVESDWIEFFYQPLLPWIHFVPIAADMHDLKDKILFLKKHDDIAKEIAKTGHDFIYNELTIDSVTCYWHQLLTDYTKLLRYRVSN
jgi:protein glucosyltransferase